MSDQQAERGEGGRLRLFGHPAHPPMTHLPIGLWAAACLADAAALLRPEHYWWPLAFWCLAAGTAAALPAAATGFVDYLALPADHPAGRTATRHLLVILAAATLFVLSLVLHRGALEGGGPARPALAVAASGLGLVLLLAGGWLGGELVYGHGLGVERAPGE